MFKIVKNIYCESLKPRYNADSEDNVTSCRMSSGQNRPTGEIRPKVFFISALILKQKSINKLHILNIKKTPMRHYLCTTSGRSHVSWAMLIGRYTGICSAGIELAASCGSQQVSSSSTFSAPETEKPKIKDRYDFYSFIVLNQRCRSRLRL